MNMYKYVCVRMIMFMFMYKYVCVRMIMFMSMYKYVCVRMIMFMSMYKYVCVRMIMFMSMYMWMSYSRNFKLKSETQGWWLSSRLVSRMLCYDRFRDGGLTPA